MYKIKFSTTFMKVNGNNETSYIRKGIHDYRISID